MKVHYSANSDSWGTPRDLFEALDAEFRFDLDPCATKETAKCARYFTQETDGLAAPWTRWRAFVNPPYSELRKWVEKCKTETEGPFAAFLAVMLIPARTDTRAWHENIFPFASEIRFLKGRVRFEGGEAGAPFPSAVVVFRQRLANAVKRPALCSAWDWRVKEVEAK